MKIRRGAQLTVASIAFVLVPVLAFSEAGGRLTPKPPDKPRINGPSVYGARPNHPFLYRIPTTGKRPMRFSAAGLPKGLKLDRATGILTGAVKTPGSTTVLFKVKNAVGTTERKFKIVIGDKLALTPPMGWSSWYFLQSGVSDQAIRAQADALVSSGLADHGYSYIDIDDGWNINVDPKRGAVPNARPRDAKGNLLTNERFPDMKALTDYLHSKGLKAGIYISPGPLTCGGAEGSLGHERQDAEQFAAWGFDLLKYDQCSYQRKDDSLAEFQKPYRLMGAILAGLDRDVVFNLCQYGNKEVWTWGREVGGHFWRTAGDIAWGPKGIYSLWGNIGNFLDEPKGTEKWAGPGGWNDPDNIIIGHIADVAPEGKVLGNTPAPLTPDEQYTHMSLWSLMAAPLIMSNDLTTLDDFSMSLLTNDEVIEVNQDSLGKQATRVFKDGGLSVWEKDLEDGSKAVGLFNLDDGEREIIASWADLGISGKHVVRDLWRQKDLGFHEQEFRAHVARHGVVLVKISR